MPPPSDQDREHQITYHRLTEAEHGWHYFRQQLDAARKVLDEHMHAIIPEGSAPRVVVDSPLVAMHRRHPRIRRSVCSSYWQYRMSS
jgi:hypothetical protein